MVALSLLPTQPRSERSCCQGSCRGGGESVPALGKHLVFPGPIRADAFCPQPPLIALQDPPLSPGLLINMTQSTEYNFWSLKVLGPNPPSIFY